VSPFWWKVSALLQKLLAKLSTNTKGANTQVLDLLYVSQNNF